MKTLPTLYLGTNTKMYKTISDTTAFVSRLNDITQDLSTAPLQIFVMPSFTALAATGELLRSSHIRFGAQNMGWEDQGQFTGEISPLMLKEVGATIAEIGHSERRHILGENDFQENRKVLGALRHRLTPLLCIGETLEQKEYGTSEEVLRTQIKIGLHGVCREDVSRIWLAYEPVWAIGVNGIPATREYASANHLLIKRTLQELFGEAGEAVPVLYGGSVHRDNADAYIEMPGIDGLFIGRAAWDADRFNDIIRSVLVRFVKKTGV
jgi:triosephosphate isomerase